jgi:ribonucleoside-diphosphate reductase alpha chain
MNSVSSGTATAPSGAHERARGGSRRGAAQMNATPATDIKFCAIDDPGCEACQ